MLNAMRTMSQSAVIKIFLMVLIGSFALWGIGDIFRGGAGSQVASVGSQSISATTFANAVNNETNRVRTMFGGSIPPEIQDAVESHILNRQINNLLLQEEANDLGLAVHDEQLKEALQTDPNFQQNGHFDPAIFKVVLRQNGLNESEFIAMLEEELLVRQLQDGLTVANVALNSQADYLHQYMNETRVVKLLTLPVNSVAASNNPDESTLLQFYEQHKEQFETDSYRGFTILPLTRDMVEKTVTVTDEDIKAYYDGNASLFTDTETGEAKSFQDVQGMIRNELQQQVVDNALYQYSVKLEDSLAAGMSLTEAATELGFEAASVKPINTNGEFQNGQKATGLNELDKLVELLFQMDEASEPVLHEMGEGYLAIQLDQVIAPRMKALEEVRARVITLWKEEQKRQLLEEKAEAVRQALESGQSIQAVQKEFTLPASKTVRLTRQKQPETISHALVEDIFNRQLHEPTIAYANQNGDLSIAVLTKIITPDTPSAMEALPLLSQLQGDFYGDVMQYYQRYLTEKHPVEIYYQPQFGAGESN